MSDKVFLNLTPQRSTLTLEKQKMLSPIFCGSFNIIRRVGPFPYEMKLLKDKKIHNVVHVGLLRKYVLDPN